jgi:DnaJ family protein B protein 12
MEGNRDEAQRAFKLAQSLQASDPAKSLKFAKKACALYWSPDAASLVKALETGEGPSTNNTNPTGSSSATPKSATAPTKRTNQSSTPKLSSSNKNQESSQNPPSYKPAQLELVKKVRRHKTTQYYEILELKRECDEAQIKSAYRKVRSIPIQHVIFITCSNRSIPMF